MLIKISLKFVPKDPINNIPASVQKTARPQAITWVNDGLANRYIYASLRLNESKLILFNLLLWMWDASDFISDIIRKWGVASTIVLILASMCYKNKYRKVSNIRRTLVGNKIADYSDVIGASPVGAAPTTSLFST